MSEPETTMGPWLAGSITFRCGQAEQHNFPVATFRFSNPDGAVLHYSPELRLSKLSVAVNNFLEAASPDVERSDEIRSAWNALHDALTLAGNAPTRSKVEQ